MQPHSTRPARLHSQLARIPGLRLAVRTLRAGWRRLGCARPRRRRQEQVAQVWGEAFSRGRGAEAAASLGWLCWVPVLERYVFPQLGGRDWYSFARERCSGRPLELGLSLCCGDGLTERYLLQSGVCRAWEGIDISPAAIASCRQAAEAAGMSTLRYRVGDLERMKLPRHGYDVVVGWMGLHHLRNLPRVFREVKRTLRPEGVFIVNEYVGPPRFQILPRQVELTNECLGLLPEDLRRRPSGEVIREFVPASAEQVAAFDPSEAVSSHQIMPLLEREFTIVERVDYGGAILHWALHETMRNFRPDDAEHMAWLERLFDFERQAMARGEIGSDFSYVIARKREGSA